MRTSAESEYTPEVAATDRNPREAEYMQAKNEHEKLCDGIRHYNHLEAVMLTVFLAANGALWSVITSPQQASKPSLVHLFEIGGLILSVVFGLNHGVYRYRESAWEQRAARLEKCLNWKILSGQPQLPLFLRPMNLAWFAFFLTFVAFWAACVVHPALLR